MTWFVTLGTLGAVLTLALLFRPFLFRRASAQVSRQQLNAAIYRDQRQRLEQDRAEGLLSEADYAQAQQELQRRVLEDSSADDRSSPVPAVPRTTLVLLGLLVPALAGGLYLWLGNPVALDAAKASAPQHQITPQDMDRLVEKLAQKLEQDPSNLQGWAMLARSYKVLGRNQEAEKAFARAGSFLDTDAQMLASYADTVATNANGNFAGKPQQLIAKALTVDPNNAMALWLAGTAAFRRDDFNTAIRTWERLLSQLDPNSDDARMLQGAVADAYARTGKTAPDSTKRASASTNTAASVSGVVELDAALHPQVAATDTVMVLARLPGTRMPIAIVRAPASALPLQFTLDDTHAMNPQAGISTAKQVEVLARISKSGMAQPEVGDLLSAVQTVNVGASGIRLHVNQVRP